MPSPFVLFPVEYQNIEFAAWYEMWFDYIGTGASESRLSPELGRYCFERIRDRASSLRGFLAFSGRPIGFVHYYFHPSSFNVDDVCMIEDLYVAPSARRHGVGRWLVEAVAQIAAEEKAPAIYWKTSAANRSAIALYQQLAEQTEFLSFRKHL